MAHARSNNRRRRTSSRNVRPGRAAAAEPLEPRVLFSGGYFTFDRVDIDVGDNPVKAVSADFDADGRADLAIAGSFDTVSVLYGQADGRLGGQRDFAVGDNPAAIATGDFNADGRPDLAVANWYGNTVSVLYGQYDGGLGGREDIPVGRDPIDIAAGDFDADGRDDIAVVSLFHETVNVLFGRMGGGFDRGENISVGNSPAGIAACDFDGDGRADLAVTNRGDGTVSIHRSRPGRHFVRSQTVDIDRGPCKIVAADFNGDNVPDLAVTNIADDSVSVLFGRLAPAGHKFGVRQDVPVGDVPIGIAAGDFDADGHADLAVANRSDDHVTVLAGREGMGMEVRAKIGVCDRPESVTVADLNGDGLLDIAVMNFYDDTVSLLYGNRPPVARDGAFEVVEDGAFSGTLVATDQGAGEALAYRIETGPAHGTITAFDAATGAFVYEPRADYNGPDGFTFTADDGTFGSNVAAMDITVVVDGKVQVGQGGAQRVTYTDADGTRGTVFITGGSAVLQFVGDDLMETVAGGGIEISGGNVQLAAIDVTHSSLASSLVFHAAGGADNVAALGTLTGSTPLGTFVAHRVDLVGDGIWMGGEGYIRASYIHDTAPGADIVMEGDGATTGVVILADRLSDDTDVELGSPLSLLRASEWKLGYLKTPWASSILITGNAAAGIRGNLGVNARFSGADAAGRGLGSLRVAGVIAGSIHAEVGSVGSIVAAQWDCGALKAQWINLIQTTGRAGEPEVDGRFGANVYMDGCNSAGISLGAAQIAGEIGGGAWWSSWSATTDWDLAGNVGSIHGGATADDWYLEADGWVNSLVATTAMGGTITAKYVNAVRTLGDLTADLSVWGKNAAGISLGVLSAADVVGDVELSANGTINLIQVGRWQSGLIEAHRINTLAVTGNRNPAVNLAGDFGAEVWLSGTGVPTNGRTLGRATILGNMTSGFWGINGDLGSLYVAGAVQGGTLRTTGDMYSVTAGTFEYANVLAGVRLDVWPRATEAYHFADPTATIHAFTVLGTAATGGGDLAWTDVSAGRFGTVSISNPAALWGELDLWCLASAGGDEIGRLTYRDPMSGQSWTYSTRSQTPLPLWADFVHVIDW